MRASILATTLILGAVGSAAVAQAPSYEGCVA